MGGNKDGGKGFSKLDKVINYSSWSVKFFIHTLVNLLTMHLIDINTTMDMHFSQSLLHKSNVFSFICIFRTLSCVCLLLLVASAVGTQDEPSVDEQWEQWKIKFEKQYNSLVSKYEHVQY